MLDEGEASRVRISFNPRLSIEHYDVVVKGRSRIDNSEYVLGQLVGEPKELPHTVWANGTESAHEFVYDFIMPEKVVEVEFQIVYNNPAASVSSDTYEALYAVVVSVDDAYVEKEV